MISMVIKILLISRAITAALIPSPRGPPKQENCGRVMVPPPKANVVGGEDAEPGAWPWQVALLENGRFECGGSLIKPDWVVTAAHCISISLRASCYEVVMGEHDRNKTEGTEVKITATKYLRHPNYNNFSEESDIALIQLEQPVNLTSHINTVCLPTQDYELPTGSSKCYITGWGKTRYKGDASLILQQTELPPVSNEVCTEKLKKDPSNSVMQITENMLCAGKERTNRSGCKGDSGGPYVCKHKHGPWLLLGVVSWGSLTCSATELYTVFARVTKFRSWIDETVTSASAPTRVTDRSTPHSGSTSLFKFFEFRCFACLMMMFLVNLLFVEFNIL